LKGGLRRVVMRPGGLGWGPRVEHARSGGLCRVLGAALLAVLSDMPPVGLRGHVLPGAGRLGLPEDGHTTGSRMEWEYSVVIDRVSLGAMGWAKTLGTDSAAPNLGRAAGRGG
jgi:hypothetical protein